MPNQYLRYGALLILNLLLSACGHLPMSSYPINTDYSTANHNSRVRHIVIHYTASPFERALKTLTQGNVSSHYLITAGPRPVIYQLVDENRRAWHAGVSHWYDHYDLNTSSIGIEIVNEGQLAEDSWAAYDPAQIEALTALLNDLVTQHQIAPENIVGHSDIAPQRKIDPGPLFPWEQLAAAGLGRWFDHERALGYSAHYTQAGLPDPLNTQLQLQAIGYPIVANGVWNQESRNVLRAFQMHYRPALYNGELDAETAGILRALQKPPNN